MQSVCKAMNCNDRAAPGDVYCDRCREEIDGMAKYRPKPVNWWAVFFVFAVIAAFAVLTWTGHI